MKAYSSARACVCCLKHRGTLYANHIITCAPYLQSLTERSTGWQAVVRVVSVFRVQTHTYIYIYAVHAWARACFMRYACERTLSERAPRLAETEERAGEDFGMALRSLSAADDGARRSGADDAFGRGAGEVFAAERAFGWLYRHKMPERRI